MADHFAPIVEADVGKESFITRNEMAVEQGLRQTHPAHMPDVDNRVQSGCQSWCRSK